MANALVFKPPWRQFLFPATRGEHVRAGTFTKDVLEQFQVGLDMRGRLPAGTTLSNATVAAVDLADDLPANVLVSPNCAIRDLYFAYATVKTGTGENGHHYRLMFDVYTSTSDRLRQHLIMIVRAS
jgi:hypothetical protein